MHMPADCAPIDRPWSLCGGRRSLHVNVIPFNIVPVNTVPNNAVPDNAVPDAAACNSGPDSGADRCASHTGSYGRMHRRPLHGGDRPKSRSNKRRNGQLERRVPVPGERQQLRLGR